MTWFAARSFVWIHRDVDLLGENIYLCTVRIVPRRKLRAPSLCFAWHVDTSCIPFISCV